MISLLNPTSLPIILLLLPVCYSWKFSTTNINLAYPPLVNSGYITENGQPVGPDDYFPCGPVPVDPSQARVPFPVTGGALTFDLTNSSAGSLSNYSYLVDVHIGQISLGNGSYSASDRAPPSPDPGSQYVDGGDWNDFSTGQQCSNPLNFTEAINNSLGTKYAAADIAGMNATLGLKIVLFGPNPKDTFGILDDVNQEEMYQCGYVTFINPDSSTVDGSIGPCLLHYDTSPTGSSASTGALSTTVFSSSMVSTATASSTRSPSPTTTGTDGVGAVSKSASHAVAIGAGVGASVGASLLILAVAVILLRRRRARKARSGTIGPHVLVGPQLPDQKAKDEKEAKGKKGHEKGVESSGNSVHSEPLPVYAKT